MATTDIEPSELTKWDPGLTERVMGIMRPFLKRYFRSEVRGLENMPPGGALLVVQPLRRHVADGRADPVGRLLREVRLRPPDVHAEPRHARVGPTGDFFKKTGFIRANHENADEALRSGGLVVVFPGGDYDVYRPTLSENKIDFGGRTGYVKAALNAGVPIVPTCRIGGQETPALPDPRHLAGQTPRADRATGPRQDRADLVRLPIRPEPGGPAEHSAAHQDHDGQVLQPIDIVAEFGENPDIDEVDAHVRHVMQRALDELAAERRLPILG